MRCSRFHVSRIHQVAFQKNQSGYSSFSFSTASLDISPGTTRPHAPSSAFSLATGNTVVPKSALFAFEAIDLICTPLSRTTSGNHSVFHCQCLDLLQSSSLRNTPRGHRVAEKGDVDTESKMFPNRSPHRISTARCHTALPSRK